MVKAYLRYTLEASLGVIASPSCNATLDPTGNYALAGTLDSVTVWNVRTGEQEVRFQESQPGAGFPTVHFPEVSRVIAPSDNKTVVSG